MDSFIVHSVLAILVALSIATWSIAIIKIKQLKKVALETTNFTQSFWSAKDWKAGEAVTFEHQGDVAALAKLGFKEFNEYISNPGSLKFAGDVQEVLDRPMRQEIQRILRRHERGLAELASIGSTAPFIGLFGTVWGIMNAMQTISATGQASIDVVAGPIGEALIATAIGIAAALPAVLFYNYFLRKMKIWVTELDGFTEDFLRLATRESSNKK
ncbi:MotA/TolQ/ExbB proton channel family protein [Polynucleobacter sp. AM-26B4]|uniref:MotA/TolQ/ExbB proton channel family protein n=1 Tax=Polynucleobacter sp. AM-26B4 TaxID=2689103 RepID=UPI001C0DEF3F|nr:MotA/TolQ/ExbB proton channel family protein [Polynucleobacter sp. AM-26B4]MBU3584571.1 MotA/TolQ/ExbB proton channel family protein [Polynucleobacter sp. AM-26B4]